MSGEQEFESNGGDVEQEARSTRARPVIIHAADLIAVAVDCL